MQAASRPSALSRFLMLYLSWLIGSCSYHSLQAPFRAQLYCAIKVGRGALQVHWSALHECVGSEAARRMADLVHGLRWVLRLGRALYVHRL